MQWFWNWIGRSQEDIAQAREDWMNGTRFGEVKGYDSAPIPAPELPPTRLKPRGRMR
ncbi:pirin [Streptomyces sp. ISL-86]|nr:pirin [Streptomyces sp. ISL-86]